MSSSGIVRGRVALAIRLLTMLKFEIHLISSRRFKKTDKRTIRLEYLRSNLRGVQINEQRKVEVETAFPHEYFAIE